MGRAHHRGVWKKKKSGFPKKQDLRVDVRPEANRVRARDSGASAARGSGPVGIVVSRVSAKNSGDDPHEVREFLAKNSRKKFSREFRLVKNSREIREKFAGQICTLSGGGPVGFFA